MFAVIETGGKQYRVSAGDYIRLEKLDTEPGKTVKFDQVVLVEKDEKIITDEKQLKKVKVIGRVVEQDRASKIIVFKAKRRKGYRRKHGHRQYFTGVCIQDIKA
jgi:large subunit ribosomal protein L21